MKLLPPGPYLPHGAEPADTIDLGVRLRDGLYTRDAVRRARESLGQLLPVVIHHGDFEAASRVCQAWLETWPAAALVDEAREAWTEGAADTARPVLERVTELHGLSRGWDLLDSGMALMPDLSWLADQIGANGDAVLVSRGEDDGSELLAELLDTTVGEVDFSLDPLPESALRWSDRLWPAKPQERGEYMVRCCEVAALPGSPERLARGDASEVGWLLWDGPHPPRPVHAAAVALMEALATPHTRDELASEIGWRPGDVDAALDSLAAVGAIKAVEHQAR
ncbi:MAG: hypothetical protein EP330_13160 [Deltaproteobacteria bacterium]|nr:MAG: hypothetical protein EP330_13160 [Deltaproteobacteria bacterium]